jgi:hypothetical protein
MVGDAEVEADFPSAQCVWVGRLSRVTALPRPTVPGDGVFFALSATDADIF